jgi:enoyl-CoA hydratase
MATTVQPASGESTKQLVNYRVDAGVAVIELCDPPANTYTYEMNRQLDEAILKARMDNDVYVIVLTGAGDKFFSAGANIKMLASVDPTFKYYFCLHANEMLLRLEHTPKLVIAALNGHCVGGGLEIAMAADIRIARQDAGKIGLPEVNLGVLPGTGGTQRLSRLVGKSKAIELMVTGNTFSFEEAKELGIINDIYERDNFMSNIMEYARQFCPPNKAAKAVGRIKRAVQTGWNAKTSKCCSRAKTPRKAWRPTWRSGRQRSRRSRHGSGEIESESVNHEGHEGTQRSTNHGISS